MVTRYQELRSELGRLRRHLLPAKFSPTGSYNDRILDRARAYRVLAHAEIESYLEDEVRDVLQFALRRWKTTGAMNKVLMSLVVAVRFGLADDESAELGVQPASIPRDTELHDFVKEAAKRAFQRIDSNNGVQERDLKKLLMLVGVRLSDLDSVWLVSMTTFGKERGQVAHLGRGGLTQQTDPEAELKRVRNDLLPELHALAVKLRGLKVG